MENGTGWPCGIGSGNSADLALKWNKSADFHGQILLKQAVRSSLSLSLSLSLLPNTQEGPLEQRGVVREESDNQPATFSPLD